MTDVSRLVSREPACEGLHYVRGKFCRISERHTNTGKSSKFGQKPFFFFKKKKKTLSYIKVLTVDSVSQPSAALNVSECKEALFAPQQFVLRPHLKMKL